MATPTRCPSKQSANIYLNSDDGVRAFLSLFYISLQDYDWLAYCQAVNPRQKTVS